MAPALDLRRDRVDVEQIVDHENRYKNEREDDGEQAQHEAEALLAEYFFYPRLGRLPDLGRGHLCFPLLAGSGDLRFIGVGGAFRWRRFISKLLDQF